MMASVGSILGGAFRAAARRQVQWQSGRSPIVSGSLAAISLVMGLLMFGTASLAAPMPARRFRYGRGRCSA